MGRAADPLVALWQRQVRHYQPLIEQIITQTERRMLAGEPVPAGEKVVSLFEPHADIIVKGSRDIDYGHKVIRRSPAPSSRHITTARPLTGPRSLQKIQFFEMRSSGSVPGKLTSCAG